MKYVQRNLTQDEKIVSTTKLHWIMALHFIKMATTEWAITNKRVMGKVGFLRVTAMDAPLDKINNVKVTQGILGRLLNYGNIQIETIRGAYIYKKIVNPTAFKKAVTEAIELQQDERQMRQAQYLR